MRSDLAEKASPGGPSVPPRWAVLVSTFFGVGRLAAAPGTWGSVAAILIWLAVYRRVPETLRPGALSSLIALSVVLGIPAATQVARAYGLKDPQSIVIDEVAGQWLSLVFAPVSWKTLIAGFILFRGFDILKPPPVRQLERLRGGLGIVADDLGAGVYALIGLQLLLHFKLLST